MAAGRNEVSADLLTDVKNYLDITWSDEATDSKVRGFIAAGMDYLDRRAGGGQDYAVDGTARTLLMEFCRYFRDSALDVFENNYRSMLLALRHERVVKSRVESAQPTE